VSEASVDEGTLCNVCIESSTWMKDLSSRQEGAVTGEGTVIICRVNLVNNEKVKV